MRAQTYALPLLLFLSLPLFGCGSGAGDCGDGVDNDGDGLVDDADPGCAANGNLESPDPIVPECSDLVDNDGDGLIDLDDPGCMNPDDDDERNNPIPQCRNGIDDDGDGMIDFPNDPGCSISLDDDETDDCPDGAECPACSNGEDDDGDGDTDYPDDLGCSSAGDRDEENADPTICGPNVPLLDLPSDDVADGATVADDSNDLISPTCGGNGPETAYRFTVDETSALIISTDFEETNVDTVLYVRSDCRMTDTEIGCNDDAETGVASRLELPRVEAGDYFLIVDSQIGESGDYKVQIERYTAEGEACDTASPTCAPGYECRMAGPGSSSETCETVLSGPTCNDGGVFREVAVPALGDLVISEYMADPSEVDDAVGEWFEVKATADVDLNGLEIGRAEPTTGPGSPLVTLDSADCLPVASGTHLLFARSDDSGVNGGLPQVDQTIDFDIVNSDDGLFLSEGGSTLDQVTWSNTATGVALSLDPGGTMWCPAVDTYGGGTDKGTPGAANPTCP